MHYYVLYRYVCGRWPDAHPSMDLSQEHSWFKERSIRVTRKIRDLLLKNLTGDDIPWAINEAQILFESCMDVGTLPFLFILIRRAITC